MKNEYYLIKKHVTKIVQHKKRTEKVNRIMNSPNEKLILESKNPHNENCTYDNKIHITSYALQIKQSVNGIIIVFTM